MKPFTEKVINIIQNIPEGSVMSYGQVAELCGNRRAARQVARILHTMSNKHYLPWHRVINAQGGISIKDEEMYQVQKLSLESEGVMVDEQGRINLGEYQHKDHLYCSDSD